MKRLASIFLVFFTATIFAQADLPRISPKGIVSQVVGYTTISLEYSRPSAHGRTIWGDLVPYNKVWRTGANEATVIQFSTDVILQGNKVPAGRYSLFTIPTEKEWTVILNKTDKQWGAYNYKAEDDFIRFNVLPVKSEFRETLEFTINNITFNTASVNFNWENVQFSFKVETDVLTLAYPKMKDAVANAKADDWQVYISCANFCAEHNVYLEDALMWTEKAIAIGGHYTSYFSKAKVLHMMNRNIDALKFIQKTREVGSKEKNYEFFVPQVDMLERDIKN